MSGAKVKSRAKSKEYMKAYYEKNKERIRERMKETMTCKYCNKVITIHNYPRHCKSKKHTLLKEKAKQKKSQSKLDEMAMRIGKKILESYIEKEDKIIIKK